MEQQRCERHRWANRQVEWSVWESDIEGKAAREAVSELGKERVSNEWERMSQKLRSWVHRWLDADVVIIRAARWPATSNKKNQRYSKDDQSDRTNDQSQQLGEKRDIRRSHRLWPLSDEIAQIMQGLSERAENRSNCYKSADDHRYQAYSTTSPRDGVHEF